MSNVVSGVTPPQNRIIAPGPFVPNKSGQEVNKAPGYQFQSLDATSKVAPKLNVPGVGMKLNLRA